MPVARSKRRDLRDRKRFTGGGRVPFQHHVSASDFGEVNRRAAFAGAHHRTDRLEPGKRLLADLQRRGQLRALADVEICCIFGSVELASSETAAGSWSNVEVHAARLRRVDGGKAAETAFPSEIDHGRWGRIVRRESVGGRRLVIDHRVNLIHIARTDI